MLAMYINVSPKLSFNSFTLLFKTAAAGAAVSGASKAIGVVFAVSAGVSAATGITSLGLQVAQHVQQQDILKDQKELAELQKELGRRQLEQYKKAEEAQQRETEMLSKTAGPIGPVTTTNMVTSSMVRNTVLNPPTNIPMQQLNLNQTASSRGSLESRNLNTPRASVSLDGSLSHLLGQDMPL